MEYQTVITEVRSAVSNDINTVNKWQKAGNAVREFYGTETALSEVKAQFIADAIIPAMNKKHAEALAATLPRKGTKEYNEQDESGKAKWEAVNQAKKDARAIAHTMFSRVTNYAFPKEKAAAEPRTLQTRFCEELAALIKAGEKAEDAGFDVVATLDHLRKALAIVAK